MHEAPFASRDLMIKLTLYKDYTQYGGEYQQDHPLNIEEMIPSDDPVRLLNQCVKRMNLFEIYRTYQRKEKEGVATPHQMLKIILYAYMNQIYSSRRIESACRRDISFIWLLAGARAPDHSTIARFVSQHFAPCAESVMKEVTEFLKEMGEISGKTIFIDGTKIESRANKYTFVWKKAVTKNMAKLLDKLAEYTGECEERYGLKITYQGKVKMKNVKKLRKKLYEMKKKENVEFVHGTGKKKHQLQKSIETLEKYLSRLKEYIKKLHICGDRNSYSKTDHEATFMRMKEDAMKNGQLKAGCNVQHGVDSEYIVWLRVGPEPTDTTTLIPFLKSMKEKLSYKYEKIIADAGYESEDNYHYMDTNGQTAFIKPANYEISKTRKYKNDIGRAENMEYDEASDSYTCRNGKTLKAVGIKKTKTKTGYEREVTIYRCTECSGCPYRKGCIKGNNCRKPIEERDKSLHISKKFDQYRSEDLERITGQEGQMLRMNRSIQVGGSFGDIKQDCNFRRFLCCGLINVKAECILLALAHNVRKLHRKIQGEKTQRYLFPLKSHT